MLFLFVFSVHASNVPSDAEKPSEKTLKTSKKQIDWGDWNKKFKPQQRYGVGIKGRLQDAISELDKSNLLDDASGVKPTKSKKKIIKHTKNIKKMKQELRALEEKVKQEIEGDEDY